MSFVFGIVLMSFLVVLTAWGFAQHRRAVPARWTGYPTLSSGFVILLVIGMPLGFGLALHGMLHPMATLAEMTPVAWAAAIAAPLAAIWLTPRLLRGARSPKAAVLPFPVRPGGGPVAPRARAA